MTLSRKSVLILVLPLLLLSATFSQQQPSAKTPKRQGTLTVTGKLVDEKAHPLAGWTVEVVEVDAQNRIVFKVEEGGVWRGFPGVGMTDDTGVFRIAVKKDFFDGDKIRFGLRTYRGQPGTATLPGQGNPHRDINAKGGGSAVFVVDDATKELDMMKEFKGPIEVKR